MSAQEKTNYRTVTVPAHENKPFEYGEYTIVPRHESGYYPEEDNYGFWVVKDHTNVMPGACWFRSVRQAIDAIKKLELAKGNADLFWLLMGGSTSTTYDAKPKSRFSVTCSGCEHTSVEGRGGNAKMSLRFKKLKLELTPTEALALVAILQEGAERTLGKEL